MYLVIAIALFLFGFLRDVRVTGDKMSQYHEYFERKSGGGKFIDPYQEYLIHCDSVHRIDTMIQEEIDKMNVKKSDYHDPFNYQRKYLESQAATKVSQKLLGVPYKTRNQLAYYLTCKKVTDMGMKVNLMWGKDTSGLGESGNTIKDLYYRLLCSDGGKYILGRVELPTAKHDLIPG